MHTQMEDMYFSTTIYYWITPIQYSNGNTFAAWPAQNQKDIEYKTVQFWQCVLQTKSPKARKRKDGDEEASPFDLVAFFFL